MDNDEFYNLATEGADIHIDVQARVIEIGQKQFNFQLSDIEYALTANKGIAATFRMYGKDLWKEMTEHGEDGPGLHGNVTLASSQEPLDKRVEW